MIPSVTAEQMKKADLMAERFGLRTAHLMENAGRSLARFAENMLKKQGNVLILSGKGNNGGDGMVAGFYLSDAGFNVKVILSDDVSSETIKKQMVRLKQKGITILVATRTTSEKLKEIISKSELIIDALIGYGLKGSPRGPAGKIIKLVNSSGRPVLSCDVPSGLDSDRGEILEPCIRATATLTLGLPKKGLLKSSAREAVGKLYLADIGIPSQLYGEVGLKVGEIFEKEKIVKVEKES